MASFCDELGWGLRKANTKIADGRIRLAGGCLLHWQWILPVFPGIYCKIIHWWRIPITQETNLLCSFMIHGIVKGWNMFCPFLQSIYGKFWLVFVAFMQILFYVRNRRLNSKKFTCFAILNFIIPTKICFKSCFPAFTKMIKKDKSWIQQGTPPSHFK